MSKQEDNWKTEIIKKLPWSATFLFASLCFFYINKELPAWICIVVAIIALFLVIRFEYYEKIIERQEKEIKYYSRSAMDTHKKTSEILTDNAKSISKEYERNEDSVTRTE